MITYYNKKEVDTLLSNKAPSNHTHTTDMQQVAAEVSVITNAMGNLENVLHGVNLQTNGSYFSTF
jgi:hypothetical protein